MTYEYAIMVETGQIEAGMADASPGEVSQSLGVGLLQIVQKVSKGIQKVGGGGWEVMSHDITRLDRHLIVSFLIRRPQQSAGARSI